MKRLLLPFFVLFLAACGGGDDGTVSAEDTAAPDTLDIVIGDIAPDVPSDMAPDTPSQDIAPDTVPDAPPDIPEGCPEGEHYGGDGVCVPVGTCSDGYHDGGEGICFPEGECSHGYWDGGDGSCVPEGSCADGYHDGGDGSCVPAETCVLGYFLKLVDEAPICTPELVLSTPEIGGVLPTVFWDGTGATILWYAPGDPGKWMKVRMTFDAQVLGAPIPHAMDVSDPGVLSALPKGGGFIAVWQQSGGLLRCMRVQQDGTSATNTLATDMMATPGEAWVELMAEGDGALVAWVDQEGTPAMVRVDDGCQPLWGPEALLLPAGETILGTPSLAAKDGVTLVGWPADDGVGEGHHTVVAYDGEWIPGAAQAWQDGPGVVEQGLRLFPKGLGFGFYGLTLGPFGGGVPTPILRDLDQGGVPKASPEAPLPTPPSPVAEPWAIRLSDSTFAAAWADPDTGILWFAAFDVDGAVVVEPTPVTNHGPTASPSVGPGSMAPIPGVGHVLVWSSALAGQADIYATIIDEDGVRMH